MNDLSKLGLALMQPELECHADWLISEGRDIELQDLCESFEWMEGDWRALARAQARLLQHHRGRIGVHAPFLNMQLQAADPRIRKVVQERYLQGLDFAQEVGGEWLVLHSPFHFFGALPALYRSDMKQEISEIELTLEPVLERAIAQNVTLVIETVYDRDVGPLLKVVQSFASPHVRLSVDTGHVHIGAGLGGLSVQGWLNQTREVLGHVHIHDNDGQTDEHQIPGEGSILWSSVLRQLRQATSDPYLIVEVMPEYVDRAADWIRSVSQPGEARE